MHRPAPPNEDWRRPDALGRVRSFAPEEGSYASSIMVPGAWADRWAGGRSVGQALGLTQMVREQAVNRASRHTRDLSLVLDAVVGLLFLLMQFTCPSLSFSG